MQGSKLYPAAPSKPIESAEPSTSGKTTLGREGIGGTIAPDMCPPFLFSSQAVLGTTDISRP